MVECVLFFNRLFTRLGIWSFFLSEWDTVWCWIWQQRGKQTHTVASMTAIHSQAHVHMCAWQLFTPSHHWSLVFVQNFNIKCIFIYAVFLILYIYTRLLCLKFMNLYLLFIVLCWICSLAAPGICEVCTTINSAPMVLENDKIRGEIDCVMYCYSK